MPTCNQSAPLAIVFEHSLPRSAKSADRIDGAIMAAGDIFRASQISCINWITVLGVLMDL